MEMTWSTKGVSVVRLGGVYLLIPAPFDEKLGKIDTEKVYKITVSNKTKRSLSANSYCWVLCDKIAQELSKNGYVSKNEVYRKCITEVGTFIDHLVPTEGKEKAIQLHEKEKDRIGNVAIELGQSKERTGYTWIRFYYGSSTYSVEEMSRLIECLIDECQQLNIPVDSDEYINSLLDNWHPDE